MADNNGVFVGISVPRTNLLMSFPTGGGDLIVHAGEDIVGAPVTTPKAMTPPVGPDRHSAAGSPAATSS